MAFYGLLRGDTGHEKIWNSIASSFIMSMGEIEYPFSQNEELNTVAVILFMIFMLLVAIVYINLLVALMTTRYEKVSNGATARALMNRAEALLKWEGTMGEKAREAAFRQVYPPKGHRSHIKLRGWLVGSATEVFVDEQKVTAVELVESPKDAYDPHGRVMEELGELREMMKGLEHRLGPRRSPSRLSSESGGLKSEESVRERLGLLKSQGSGFSKKQLGSIYRREGSVSTPEELQRWRDRAKSLEKTQKSKKAIVRAQALIRGYLQRSRDNDEDFMFWT
ncbi:unnamed protein product [Choristocarpus tenellus]